MCLEYEWEYHKRIAEEMKKRIEERERELRNKPKPAAPAAAPEGKPSRDLEPAPV